MGRKGPSRGAAGLTVEVKVYDQQNNVSVLGQILLRGRREEKPLSGRCSPSLLPIIFHFPKSIDDGLNNVVFPMAYWLKRRGTHLRRGIWELCTLDYVRNVIWSVWHYNVVSYIDVNFLQSFYGEVQGALPQA